MKRGPRSLLAVLCLLLSASVAAEPVQSISIGGELLSFDYREFDETGRLLDRESGWLPGFAAHWQLADVHWFMAAEGELHPGVVEYDGQTQSGIPTRTDTRTLLFDARLLGGYAFGHAGQGRLRLYGGAGYHYWFRDILPGTAADGSAVAGLLEEYQWVYLIAGGRFRLFRVSQHELAFDARYHRMLFGTMDVDFKGFQGYDRTDLALATEDGLRLALLWRWRLRADEAMIIEPYVATWNLGRSHLAALTRNGTATGDLILEPRSETRNAGLRVRFHKRF